ncbi:resuscitation-promoting factor Rpf1 domain-containing protein [Corynebacterium sphenisci]|uniref:resuscitation-promoting factor Rpf1 domain-containing protein n=1 Tax=Corynebacterium sphenisci TaxID=191493 RepID=UPI0026E0A04E|nr:resuscitation-promoting factor Rpf1 domain-containing protein [Corynebacterium sphenisci]MDO5731410.1 DUF3235 domain-containing protein [Corynebacterium sphenisci]
MARHSKKARTISTTAKVAATGVALGAGAALLAPAANAAPYSDWERLAQCESGGNWSINTGNGYYGGLQFSASTWNGYGGQEFAPYANQATKDQQIWVAEKVLAAQGWGAWPSCSAKLGLHSSANTGRAKPVNGTTGHGNAAPKRQAAPAPKAGVNPVSAITGVAADPAGIAGDPAAAIARLGKAADIASLDAIFQEITGAYGAKDLPVPAQVAGYYDMVRDLLPA